MIKQQQESKKEGSKGVPLKEIKECGEFSESEWSQKPLSSLHTNTL